MSTPPPHHVLIIGAGPIGLLIAQGLRKNSIPFTIFERSARARSRNWAVTVHWATKLVKEELLPDDLSARFPLDAQTDPYDEDIDEAMNRRDARTGEHDFRAEMPGAREINIAWAKRLFAEGIDVKVDKSLESISYPTDQTVTARFTDGTSATGTVLVGCDGGGSVVRKLLLGAEKAAPTLLPYTLMNLTTTYDRDQALWLKERVHKLVDIACHPHGTYCRLNVLEVEDKDRPETWVWQILASWKWPDGEPEDATLCDSTKRLQRLKEIMSDWADPHGNAIKWLKEDTEVLPDAMRVWRSRDWIEAGKGRVTLAGDAAHASTFHRGQGVNNGITDAVNFVNAMIQVQRKGTAHIPEALNAYDREVIERGALEVDISSASTEAMHDPEKWENGPAKTLGSQPHKGRWSTAWAKGSARDT